MIVFFFAVIVMPLYDIRKKIQNYSKFHLNSTKTNISMKKKKVKKMKIVKITDILEVIKEELLTLKRGHKRNRYSSYLKKFAS